MAFSCHMVIKIAVSTHPSIHLWMSLCNRYKDYDSSCKKRWKHMLFWKMQLKKMLSNYLVHLASHIMYATFYIFLSHMCYHMIYVIRKAISVMCFSEFCPSKSIFLFIIVIFEFKQNQLCGIFPLKFVHSTHLLDSNLSLYGKSTVLCLLPNSFGSWKQQVPWTHVDGCMDVVLCHHC